MEEGKPVLQWKKTIYPVLQSKKEEFHLLGYSRAHEEDIWKCLEKKVWKGNPTLRLHTVVQDVFHLSVGTYMSYLTIQAYQSDDLLAQVEALRNHDPNKQENEASY
ncbi:post-transcriptional regulator [Pontibacillus salipaludis]|uniref:Post-transcriptional regulator n=1 Tax=Pontibacillus salipaludis TaxID=1697394 RepID=A0ABQ1PUK7_9BACI|nr:post-transcriptional regulator [Pontibacillus salipaludis]GGD03854.1 hypothetical protein GCM10011389_09200 [Pontibacillus salipaludis]